jgi:hypothetical protein
MGTYNSTDMEVQRQRAQYDREIWRGGIALLVLLPLLSIAILHPAFRGFEPFLGLGIGLLIVILGCRLIFITHRDAQIAQYGIQPEQDHSQEPYGAPAFVAAVVLVVSVPLAVIFSPQLGGISAATLGVGLWGLEKLIMPIFDDLVKLLKRLGRKKTQHDRT